MCSPHPGALHSAASQLAVDRLAAEENGVYIPGLAEYLDLLRATHFAVVEQQRFQPAPIEDEGSGQGPIFESVALLHPAPAE